MAALPAEQIPDFVPAGNVDPRRSWLRIDGQPDESYRASCVLLVPIEPAPQLLIKAPPEQRELIVIGLDHERDCGRARPAGLDLDLRLREQVAQPQWLRVASAVGGGDDQVFTVPDVDQDRGASRAALLPHREQHQQRRAEQTSSDPAAAPQVQAAMQPDAQSLAQRTLRHGHIVFRSVVAFGPVYLVRHGDTDWPSVDDGPLRGHGKDFAPLTTVGVREAESAAASLVSVGADKLLSSPMTRALQTAAIVGVRTSLIPCVELDLREWSPSRLQQWTTVDEVIGLAKEMWSHGGEWPAGETREWEPISSVRRRVLDVLVRHRSDKPLIAVTHGAVIESILGRIVTTGEICEWNWTPAWLDRWPASGPRANA